MCSAFSILSFGLLERSSPSSLMTFTRVACSPTASPTERSMKSPALGSETMIVGMERKARVALHIPPPQETPIPVKLWSSSSEKMTARPSLIAIAL
jgi:hypothetical protein